MRKAFPVVLTLFVAAAALGTWAADQSSKEKETERFAEFHRMRAAEMNGK